MNAEMLFTLKNFTAQKIQEKGLTQGEASRLFGVNSARVCTLCNGKPGKFSQECLFDFLRKLGENPLSFFKTDGSYKESFLSQIKVAEKVKKIRKPMPTRAELLDTFFDLGKTVTWKKSGTGRKFGKPITNIDGRGYLAVTLRGTMVNVHRVLWVMRNGDIPVGATIDHIDGDKLNNLPENLRLTTLSQNNQNRRSHSNNTSGAKCVTWNKNLNKWHVQMGANGISVYIGSFSDYFEAVEAAQLARERLHCEFTNHAGA